MTDKTKLKECVRLLDSSATSQLAARVALFSTLAGSILCVVIDHYRGNTENGTANVAFALTGGFIYVGFTWKAATAALKAKRLLEKVLEP